LTSEEKRTLKALLTKMMTEQEPPSDDEPQGRPAGYVPESCLLEFYKATRTPFLEIIIYRENDGGYEYLYQDRHDEHWNGFCAFGGMVRAAFPASPVAIAQKLIDREFKGMDITVAELQVVSFLNWPEHPWCNPFAVVCLVSVNREIPAGGDRRWLSARELPENMVMNHGMYLRQCEHFLLGRSPLKFTPHHPNGI
jgi:hypothetical protein